MNLSLPDALQSFVDEQATVHGLGTGSEYVHALIRKEADLLRLRGLLLQGANAEPAPPVDEHYFTSLRARVQNHHDHHTHTHLGSHLFY